MKNIAFITCARKSMITDDDQLLADVLAEQGCIVHGIPWDSKNIDWSDFDLLVLRSCWDYHLRSIEFLRWVEFIEQRNLALMNSPDLVRWNMNKKYLFEMKSQGVLIPEGVLIGKDKNAYTLPGALDNIRAEKLVVKPAVSASAFQTHLVSREELLKNDSLMTNLFEHGDVIVQEFLDEIKTQGEISLMYFGGQFSHAVLKQAKPGDFRVQSDFGGTVTEFSPAEALLRQTDSIISKVPDCLYARVDGLEVNGKFMLMELELVEPVLFFQESHSAAQKMASAIFSILANIKK